MSAIGKNFEFITYKIKRIKYFYLKVNLNEIFIQNNKWFKFLVRCIHLVNKLFISELCMQERCRL